MRGERASPAGTPRGSAGTSRQAARRPSPSAPAEGLHLVGGLRRRKKDPAGPRGTAATRKRFPHLGAPRPRPVPAAERRPPPRHAPVLPRGSSAVGDRGSGTSEGRAGGGGRRTESHSPRALSPAPGRRPTLTAEAPGAEPAARALRVPPLRAGFPSPGRAPGAWDPEEGDCAPPGPRPSPDTGARMLRSPLPAPGSGPRGRPGRGRAQVPRLPAPQTHLLPWCYPYSAPQGPAQVCSVLTPHHSL